MCFVFDCITSNINFNAYYDISWGINWQLIKTRRQLWISKKVSLVIRNWIIDPLFSYSAETPNKMGKHNETQSPMYKKKT